MPRPPPPPPPPPPGARSRASLTVSGRPPNGLPLRALTAAWAWASVASSTKAKPRGRPVSRSVPIFTSSTWRPSCSTRAPSRPPPRRPGGAGGTGRLLHGPDHRHRSDRGAGPEGDVHEAVSELDQPIALPEGPAERLHALREGEHGAAGAEQVRARVAASVHGPDAPRGPADDRQLPQAGLGHALDGPRPGGRRGGSRHGQ